MNTFEFLAHLRSLDINLLADDERLRIKAPLGVLSPPLRAELAERKAEIITLLRGANVETLPMLPVPRDKNLPLSFAQQRLWFLNQLEPDSSAHYNMHSAYQLTGPLNTTALKQSLAEIVERHEAFRTTFPTVKGQPVQTISPTLSWTLPIVDLSDLSTADRKVEVRRLTAEEAQQPFDLARGPLWQITLARLAEEEHILLLTIHHIVCDGWSVQLLFRELSTLYKAFSTGQPSPLPELPIQYADFAVWQREWLRGQALEKQLGYWKKQLAGAPPVLELPADRPRPSIQTFRGAEQVFELPKTLSEALKALSRQEGATLFMTLLAAFKILLYRYTGQDDIVIGSPIANRNRVEIEGVIGFFTNTLMLRVDHSGEPAFRELLARVREVALETYAHQDVPFEKLVEELQPERDLSRSPLFQVMFAFQTIPRQPLQLPGLTVNPYRVDIDTAKFDLTLFMTETTESLRGLLEYNTDLFDAGTIKRMIGHFQTLLAGIVANPDTPISQLPLLTKAEQHQLLVAWNNTRVDYPENVCFHQLFEAQVRRTPEAVAVVYKDQQVTYRELNRRANQLAHYLIKQGVKPETLVGICIERSPEMIVGLLGILKAGGAYVPLDPTYPRKRLAFMLEDANVSLVLSQASLAAGLKQRAQGARHRTITYLDADWVVIARENDQNLTGGVTPDNLAYVMYTSGSTGQPKGAMIPHRGLTNYLNWAAKIYEVAAGQGAPVHSSLSFDLTITALFLPLLTGQCVTLVPEEVVESEALSHVLRHNNDFSLVKITPAHLEMLSYLLPAAEAAGRTRRFIIGGEALRAENLAFWQKYAPDTKLVNEYGPTETVVGCCVYEVTTETGLEGTVPIGRPIANTQLYLLDRHLNPVPIGVPGELHIGGAGLARGYLNRPELTAEKFIQNPFSNEPGARLYKTGDLARYLPDGNIEFLGRLDDQVKIRGFRIELGEIETVLQQHPSLSQAVILAREDKPNEKRLVAYIVPNQKPAPKTADLRNFLRWKLPEYMIPSVFVTLNKLPLTSNGKVDRRALPAPDQTLPELENAFAPPQTPMEKALAGIWAEVLELERVGLYDNFFELGGHSLLAVRLFTQIEKTLNKKLPIATLFQAPTVEQLADIISRAERAADWSPLVTIQSGDSTRPPFFCVHGWGGGVVGYADLARLLGPEQPFYGLQARGLNGVEEPHTRITDMAADYLKAVRAVQSTGPYYLGGYCQGGVIAFEMAQQLQAQGERVALLVAFESYAPIKMSAWDRLRAPNSIINFMSNLPYWFIDYRQLGYKGILMHIRRKTKNAWGYLTGKARAPNRINLEDILDDVIHIPKKRRELMEIHALAGRNYNPQLYNGRITLFRARSLSLFHSFDPDMGWGKLATGGVEIKRIAGAHRNILERPYVEVLAEQLKSSLEQVQTMAPYR